MLQLQTFAQWTNQFAAAVQSAASSLTNFASGTILLALAQANASVALWFQWLLLMVLSITRAATSTGTYLDTWMADFDFTRLGATYATGSVTFERFTPTNSALIVPYYNAAGGVNATGALVQTTDGTQQFGVTTLTTNSYWNAQQGGYLIPANTGSATLPVQALNIGTQGNVAAGAVALLASGISGVDTCTNASAFTNGLAAETDAAFRARFVLYINSMSEGTVAAVENAVLSVQQNLTCTVQPGTGSFVVTVDDGTGNPSSATLAAVLAAVGNVYALGITYSVQGPTEIVAAVAFTLTAASGYTKANMIPVIATALTAYINALPMGAALPYSRVAQVIYDATPGVANVTGLTLNGLTADLGGSHAQCVRAGAITIS